MSPPFEPFQLENSPDQKEFTKLVVLNISSKWRTFGILLGIKNDTLNAVSTRYDKIQEDCFHEVYSIWESETPSPFTWKTVIGILQEMGENKQVKEIKKHLGMPLFLKCV